MRFMHTMYHHRLASCGSSKQNVHVNFTPAELTHQFSPAASCNTYILKLEHCWYMQDGVRGSTKIHLLPNAGHWVHMDNPKGLIDMIVESEQ